MTPDRRTATTVELSVRSIVRFIGIVLVTLASLWLLIRIGKVITWIVVSAFFAIVLTPPVNLLNHRLKIKRGIATALVFVGALAILVGLIFSFVRPIASQTGPFIKGLPEQIAEAQRGEGPVGKLVKRYKVEDRVRSNLDKLNTYVNDLGRNAVGVVTNVFNTLFAVVTVAVLTVLMVLQGPSLLTSGVGLLSPPNQERMMRLGRESAKAVTGYVAGNLLISVIAGSFTWIFLSIVGVPFAGVLALWVAFADLIPLVGATMGAIPTVGIAFLHSTTAGVATLIFYFIYQQFENHVLQVTIMSRAVAIKPLVVLVSVLAGVELFGILGALLAIPIAAVVKVIGTEILRMRRPDVMATVDARKAAEHAHQLEHPHWWKQILNRATAATKADSPFQNNEG
jgi:predicted PurR-regulated permease PerM